MIRRLALVLALLSVPAIAPAVETQAAIAANVKQILINYAHVPPGNVAYVMAALGIPKIYATAAELTAASPVEGTLGYASDTNVFYLRVGSSWTSIATIALLENGATWTNAVDGTTTLTEGGETEQHVVTNNLITLTSSSGATYAVTPAIAFAGDVTLNGAAGALTCGTAGCSLVAIDNSATGFVAGATGALAVWTLDTRDGVEGEIVTGYSTVSGLITGTGGVKTTKPLFVYDKLRFCGNGSNGATAWYDGPVLFSDVTDSTLGSALCDANDSGTEATADRPFDPYSTIKIVGMACVTQAGGAADTNTFQLRTATADVAGVTCAVTNDGTLPKTCSVILAAPVTITAGATLAVKNTQSGTDDMSAKDMGCTAYFTY